MRPRTEQLTPDAGATGAVAPARLCGPFTRIRWNGEPSARQAELRRSGGVPFGSPSAFGTKRLFTRRSADSSHPACRLGPPASPGLSRACGGVPVRAWNRRLPGPPCRSPSPIPSSRRLHAWSARSGRVQRIPRRTKSVNAEYSIQACPLPPDRDTNRHDKLSTAHRCARRRPPCAPGVPARGARTPSPLTGPPPVEKGPRPRRSPRSRHMPRWRRKRVAPAVGGPGGS